MGTTGYDLSFTKKALDPSLAPPMPPRKVQVFTDQEVMELKQIMREVLEEYGLSPTGQI
jgi:hypothetical protein